MTAAANPLPFWHPASLVATVGGIGLLPYAPGTWASLAALPLAWLIRGHAGPGALLAASIVLFLAGWWAAGFYIGRLDMQDPPAVVVDEVVAQWLVLLAAPQRVWLYVAGFLLFRLFDILKPWPINLADRHIKGGFGTMVDDLLAAFYASLCLGLLHYVMGT